MPPSADSDVPVDDSAKSLGFKQELGRSLDLLDRAVKQLDTRLVIRSLRALGSFRRRVDLRVLVLLIENKIPQEFDLKQPLLHALTHVQKARSSDMEADDKEARQTASAASAPQVFHTLEACYFICLIALLLLFDNKDFEQAAEFGSILVKASSASARHTCDPIFARIYFYHSLSLERCGKLNDSRSVLLLALRSSTIRHNEETQATVLNLLLRNYIKSNLYTQAEKLATNSPFPESAANNNQLARYMYYLGRIKAVHLDYSAAHAHLLQASRKAPQGRSFASGFQQIVHKFLVVVQLLMGEIPERSIFRTNILRKSLKPYLEICQAVRIGDLAKFHNVLEQHTKCFDRDGTLSLILRLRHNVIKTGLESEADAEYIVAKAIRDGIIEANVIHEQGCVQTKETTDVYLTTDPQRAYDQRIQFCLQLHNECVKALRFPKDAHRKDLELAEEAMTRERELAQEIADGDFLDGDEDAMDEF